MNRREIKRTIINVYGMPDTKPTPKAATMYATSITKRWMPSKPTTRSRGKLVGRWTVMVIRRRIQCTHLDRDNEERWSCDILVKTTQKWVRYKLTDSEDAHDWLVN